MFVLPPGHTVVVDETDFYLGHAPATEIDRDLRFLLVVAEVPKRIAMRQTTAADTLDTQVGFARMTYQGRTYISHAHFMYLIN